MAASAAIALAAVSAARRDGARGRKRRGERRRERGDGAFASQARKRARMADPRRLGNRPVGGSRGVSSRGTLVYHVALQGGLMMRESWVRFGSYIRGSIAKQYRPVISKRSTALAVVQWRRVPVRLAASSRCSVVFKRW